MHIYKITILKTFNFSCDVRICGCLHLCACLQQPEVYIVGHFLPSSPFSFLFWDSFSWIWTLIFWIDWLPSKPPGLPISSPSLWPCPTFIWVWSQRLLSSVFINYPPLDPFLSFSPTKPGACLLVWIGLWASKLRGSSCFPPPPQYWGCRTAHLWVLPAQVLMLE